MKLLKTLLTAGLILSPVLAKAQGAPPPPDFMGMITQMVNDATGGPAGRLLYTRAGSYYGVMGTPYINKSWVTANIYDMNGKKYESKPIMYNAHYDLIEAVVGKDTLILDSNKISKVELPLIGEDNTIRSAVLKTGFKSEKEKIAPHMFFEVLHEGEQFTVLKKHYKNLKKSDFNPAYNTGSKYDEFQYVGTVYVQKAGGNIERLKTNKKGVLSLFGDKSKLVDDYVKRQKLEYGKDQDLGKIFAYYESL